MYPSKASRYLNTVSGGKDVVRLCADRRIGSLLDLYRIDADKYTQCCFALNELRYAAVYIGDGDKDQTKSLEEIRESLASLKRLCVSMHLDCVAQIERTAKRISERRDPTGAHDLITEVEHAVLRAFKNRDLYLLTEEESALHRWSIPPSIGKSFPGSVEEIFDAVGCLIFDQPKAAVFHSMNALEQPLGVMARYFGVRFDDQTTWASGVS